MNPKIRLYLIFLALATQTKAFSQFPVNANVTVSTIGFSSDATIYACATGVETNVYLNSEMFNSPKADQTISFNAIPVKSCGSPGFNPGATASSGLTVSYSSSNTQVATVSGCTIYILGYGTSLITAFQNGNETYNAATSVQQTLTVSDLVNPTITAPPRVNATTNSNCMATGVYLGTPIASDNCGVVSVSNNAPSIYSLGTTIVTWKVTDVSGRTSNATQTVTVTDNVNPVIAAPPAVYVFANASNNATGVALGTPVFSDNCSVTHLSVSAPAFYPIGTTEVIWSVTDGSGRTATASQFVVVTANNLTITSPPNVNMSTNVGCTATDVVLGTPAISNNFGPTTILNNAPPSFPLGETTVIWTVTDSTGRTATATQTVIVSDNIIPTAIARNITIGLDSFGSATITPADIDNGSSDNCSILSIIANKTEFDCSNLGNNYVALTVIDASGNASTAIAVVTITDSLSPTVITRNITVNLDETGNATITVSDIDNGSFDNCTISTTSLNTNNFDCSDIGTKNIALTITDETGNTSSAQAIVTIADITPPVVNAQDITVVLDASGTAVVSPQMVDNGSHDNCGIVEISLNLTSIDCSLIGLQNPVQLTVSDISGNTIATYANIIVIDTIAPEISNPGNQYVSKGTNCESILADYSPTVMINDNCQNNLTISQSPVAGTIFTDSLEVTLIATDISGNTGTTSFMVVSQDNMDPVAIAKNISVYLNSSGSFTVNPAALDNGSTDNCAITSFGLDVSTFDCSSIGAPQPVVFTVFDSNNNFASVSAIITVLDTLTPEVITRNLCVILDTNNVSSITPNTINNGSTDNCGIVNMAVSISNFDCSNIGTNHVDLIVTDYSGNLSTGTAEVVVKDITPPIALTRNISVFLDETGKAVIDAKAVNNGSYDNCTSVYISINKTSFNCSNLGKNNVMLTTTDESGNTATAIAVVTVSDTISPSVSCLPDTIIEVSAFLPSYLVSGNFFDPIASDNCSYEIFNNITSTTTLEGAVLQKGINAIEWTVTDADGNKVNCISNITIEVVTSVSMILPEHVELFPNPANNMVNLILPDEGIHQVTIINMTGAVLQSYDLANRENVLDVSEFAAGIYFVKVKSKALFKTFWLVIE